MPRIATRSLLFAVTLLLGVALANAQQGQSQEPSRQSQGQGNGQQTNANGTLSSQPAPYPANSASQQNTQPTATASPSLTAQPLTGAEEFTLKRMVTGRNYFIPSFQFGQSLISSGNSHFPASNMESISTISGEFTFHHAWRRYDFSAQYSGTGMFYRSRSTSDTSAHNFTVSQRIAGKRSSFLLTDVVNYLPESGYGYARFGGLGTFGGAGSGYGGLFTGATGGLDTTFLPGQTILTAPSSQVGNSVVAQYNYLTSPISTLTLTGAYVSLFFPGSGFLNTNDIIAGFGYDHTLSLKNSIGLSYQANIYRYGPSGGDFTNHIISLMYRRTVSNRFAFEVGAGPQINTFANTAAKQNTQFSWETHAQLNYQLEHFSTTISYFHYTSGGSGVYSGAHTDTVTVQSSIPISRMLTGSISLGYAYNTTLYAEQISRAALSYNSWYGTLNLHYTLNRQMSLFLGYNLRQQMTPQATCVGTTCGTFYAQQYLSFGINWHPIVPGVE